MCLCVHVYACVCVPPLLVFSDDAALTGLETFELFFRFLLGMLLRFLTRIEYESDRVRSIRTRVWCVCVCVCVCVCACVRAGVRACVCVCV